MPPIVRAGNRGLEFSEGVVYVGIAAFLLVLAVGLTAPGVLGPLNPGAR